MKSTCPMEPNVKVGQCDHILPPRVGFSIGLVGTCVGLVETYVGSARLLETILLASVSRKQGFPQDKIKGGCSVFTAGYMSMSGLIFFIS